MAISSDKNISKAILSTEYKNNCFWIWYSHDKPTATNLHKILEPDSLSGDLPAISTLNTWLVEFRDQAEEMDAEIYEKRRQEVTKEKIAMMERHAGIASRMQDMALDYLEEHKEDLKVSNAVRLLIEGVRIERESRGIPSALQKILDKTDEQLLEEIQEIFESSPITSIEANEDD